MGVEVGAVGAGEEVLRPEAPIGAADLLHRVDHRRGHAGVEGDTSGGGEHRRGDRRADPEPEDVSAGSTWLA